MSTPLTVPTSGTTKEALTCSICLDDITSECESIETPCAHIFHRKCLQECSTKSINGCLHCPNCRECCASLFRTAGIQRPLPHSPSNIPDYPTNLNLGLDIPEDDGDDFTIIEQFFDMEFRNRMALAELSKTFIEAVYATFEAALNYFPMQDKLLLAKLVFLQMTRKPGDADIATLHYLRQNTVDRVELQIASLPLGPFFRVNTIPRPRPRPGGGWPIDSFLISLDTPAVATSTTSTISNTTFATDDMVD